MTIPVSAQPFHDACGTGFITELSGSPSRRVVTLSLEALKRLSHRGARSADDSTGDGSGILTDIPRPFFREIMKREMGATLESGEVLALGMVFTSAEDQTALIRQFKSQSRRLGIRYIGMRDVPVDMEALGKNARATCPRIIQIFLACPTVSALSTECSLFLLRKRIERSVSPSTHICSLSSLTVVYKGLLTSEQIDRFYGDLNQEAYQAKVALFHERFSTNTRSTWDMAQPFRLIAHNGEINTIKGNRLWMRSREKTLKSDLWKTHLDDLRPVVRSTGSDSYSFDNALEFLSKSGRSIFHSLMMMIPEPYAGDLVMDQALRDFYIYHENFIEPWDGPAAVVFTDGEYVGAKLDRNGLRPLRYTLTRDGLVIMASEAGVIQVEEDNLLLHHHMTSGEIFAVSLDGGGILDDETIKRKMANRAPYSDLIRDCFKAVRRSGDGSDFQPFPLPAQGFDPRLRIALGWNREDLTHFLIPMADSGNEPIGAMGDDTPPAFLSDQDRRFYDYFKQAFAQVTNPPIDPIREKRVTALTKYLGSEDNLLNTRPEFRGAIRIDGPVLSPAELTTLKSFSDWFPHTTVRCHVHRDETFREHIEVMKQECEDAVLSGNKIIFLSDEGIDVDKLPIPMALAVSIIHHHLSAREIRSRVSLICLAGDAVSDHHIACLVGMGASAVYPTMAYELIREQYRDGDWSGAMFRYRSALEKGLLKIMSKMGISTLTSYHGSMLFQAIGLDNALAEVYFPSISNLGGGINLDLIHGKLTERNRLAFHEAPSELPMSGFFQYRKGGEAHGFNPEVCRMITSMAETGTPRESHPEKPVYLRDLLDFVSETPVPAHQVESVQNITPRFGGGGISFGAISDESHRAIARGVARVGGRSNTGEGGEPDDRRALSNPDRTANSHIKQIASGRFGVTVDYLASACELQIKIAQGAKPGEGGQLPGHKVTVQIAGARSSTPGVTLISPPPHHDIYSIEDIAQLIYDLKQVNSRARVSVKLVSQPGIGTVASGVAKAGADIIVVSCGTGGTGASPLGSIKHAGLPWELGLHETHTALVEGDLRARVTLRADGGLKNGKDIVTAALLGAEEFDFGTPLMIAVGCTMCRNCHKNTCPKGIATQDDAQRARFRGTPAHVSNYLNAVAEEVRHLLTGMGYRSLDEIIGRTELMRYNDRFERYISERNIAFGFIAQGASLKQIRDQSPAKISDDTLPPHLDDILIREARQHIMTHSQAVVTADIVNTDRAVGARLSGELSYLFGKGNFHGNIQCQLHGVAGQSFGAFLSEGIELRLCGVANDFVGKGMNGGLITIRLPAYIRAQHKQQTIIGNVALYGATGGRLLVAGRAGERFAVRNSGCTAVVEGLGNHGCEYMTRGTVVVLGGIGQNFGAGMTGGSAFLYLEDRQALNHLNVDYVRWTEPSPSDEQLVLRLLRGHVYHTGSVQGDFILNYWEQEKSKLVKVQPLAMDGIDFGELYKRQIRERRELRCRGSARPTPAAEINPS